MDVALWGFPSLARVEELHRSDAPKNLPETVKRLQASSSLSLASSHLLPLGRWLMPTTEHPFSWCLNMLCILLKWEPEDHGPPVWGARPWWVMNIHEVHGMLSPAGNSDHQLLMKPNLSAQLSQGKAPVPHPMSPLLGSSSTVAPSEGCPVPPPCAGAQQGRTGPCSPANTQDKHVPAVSLGWCCVHRDPGN